MCVRIIYGYTSEFIIKRSQNMNLFSIYITHLLTYVINSLELVQVPRPIIKIVWLQAL